MFDFTFINDVDNPTEAASAVAITGINLRKCDGPCKRSCRYGFTDWSPCDKNSKKQKKNVSKMDIFTKKETLFKKMKASLSEINSI